jgi:DNA-directed RNA polymerase subunit delta
MEWCQLRPVDIAYDVLRDHGQPLLVHDLIERVLERLQEEPEARRMAQIYSDINLDVRFVYRGNGLWGLRDWSPDARHSDSKDKDRDEDAEELEEEEGWE